MTILPTISIDLPPSFGKMRADLYGAGRWCTGLASLVSGPTEASAIPLTKKLSEITGGYRSDSVRTFLAPHPTKPSCSHREELICKENLVQRFTVESQGSNLYRGIEADSFIGLQRGEAYIISAADCMVGTAITRDGVCIPFHAGYRSIFVPEGQKSVIQNIFDALTQDQREGITFWWNFGISRHGLLFEQNHGLIDSFESRFQGKFEVGSDLARFSNNVLLFDTTSRQRTLDLWLSLYLEVNWVFSGCYAETPHQSPTGMVCTDKYDDLHSHRKDPTKKNLIIISRIG